MIVKDLISELEKLPQDKSIVCQVVGKESGAWNMEFELNDIPDSWMIQLKVSHRQLLNLNMDWD